jgi:MFS family permease
MEIKKTRSAAWWHTLIAALSAFSVYTCMYAFRKPFTAAGFDHLQFLHMDYKIWLIIAQTTGYTFSKFFGIRFIAELKKEKRFQGILKLIGIAWVALLLFAIVPAPFNIIFLLINGFPLGIIYGLVFSYLEGRRTTELLGAVLSTSFIFASGFTLSVGKYVLLNGKVSEFWMPFITGLIFLLPLIFFTWLLDRTPLPTETDIQLRTERKPMGKTERRNFIQTFFPGLLMLIITYIMLTIIRDYRSNFASEIWNELGRGKDASVFTKSELPASIIVLVIMSLLILVKRNIQALLINHVLIIFGFLISLGSTLLFQYGLLDPFWWMTLTGVGLYMGYVPFNCMLFERLIASFKYVSTAGFIIYVADSFGYLGSDVILLLKNFGHMNISWSEFFINMVIVISISGMVLTGISANYFRKKYRHYSPGNINLIYA